MDALTCILIVIWIIVIAVLVHGHMTVRNIEADWRMRMGSYTTHNGNIPYNPSMNESKLVGELEME